MSEYQYYEFAAIDEPLSDKQMRELRALSTRAEITPTSFVNEYHWGDFKGDPRKLIVDYFDAFLYYANWGTLWCMFRLPKDAVDLAALKRFDSEAIAIRAAGTFVIVDICLDDEPGDYETPFNLTLGRLLPARDALLEGELGPLYAAWLAAVQRYQVEDDATEPCDASQLPPMGAGTKAIASFCYVNDDLLKAGLGPARKSVRVDKPADMVKWIRALPPQEKDDYLAQFLAEPATIVRSKLLKQYRASKSAGVPREAPSHPRTAAELRAAAKLE